MHWLIKRRIFSKTLSDVLIVFRLTIKVAFLFIFCCLPVNLLSQEIQAALKIKTAGAVTDLTVSGSSILLSTDAGTIETYNINSGKKTNLLQLPSMKDFMGDDVPTKIFSIDDYKGKQLLVTQGLHGFRNVLILENEDQLEIISSTKDKLMIKKARWLDENSILLGLMSNELMVYKVDSKQYTCTLSISPYTFSDFSLTDDKYFVFTADESGIVHQVEIKTCSLKQDFEGVNVDNIYQLVSNSGIVITAGQDRRVGVYNTITDDHYYLQKDFLVYSVGLSPDGSVAAYSATEENEISIFSTVNKREVCILKGHESVVTKLYFINNSTLISAGDDHQLMIWKIE